jgi:DNA integrity scanning protein DisA with diadenylate cyclase activity
VKKVEVPRALAEAAVHLASAVNADAILLQTETDSTCRWLLNELRNARKEIKLIVATSNRECSAKLGAYPGIGLVEVPAWQAGRMAKAGQLIAQSLQRGHISEGQRLVCLLGDGYPDSIDLIKIWDVTGEEYMTQILSNEVLAATVELSIELATATGNKKPVGTAFLIGDTKNVLRLSYQIMIDPFKTHRVNIKDRSQWELVKKYAASFDGAFVIDPDGVIVAAHRFLAATARCDIPPGLGTRHHAVGAMTAETAAKGVTISQEDALIRVFENGRIMAKVNPRSRIIECFREPR